MPSTTWSQLFSAMLVLSSCLLCQHADRVTTKALVLRQLKPPKPELKGPDQRNLESLFSPRYSNQAVHRASTLVLEAFANKPPCCTFSCRGWSKGPSAPPITSSTGNPPAPGYPDLSDIQLAPQTEPYDPSQVPWRAHLTETSHLEVGATINGIIICVLMGSQNPAFGRSQWM